MEEQETEKETLYNGEEIQHNDGSLKMEDEQIKKEVRKCSDTVRFKRYL